MSELPEENPSPSAGGTAVARSAQVGVQRIQETVEADPGSTMRRGWDMAP